MSEYSEFLVDTPNPDALDDTLQQIGAVLVGRGEPDYIQRDGHYVVRCFGNEGFIRFAIKNQGYASIVEETPSQP